MEPGDGGGVKTGGGENPGEGGGVKIGGGEKPGDGGGVKTGGGEKPGEGGETGTETGGGGAGKGGDGRGGEGREGTVVPAYSASNSGDHQSWATPNRPAAHRCSKLTISPIFSGNGPNSLLKLTSNTVKFFSRPISGGRHDIKSLFINIISFRLVIFPMLAGEPVMVYENRVQRLVKQGRGNRPFELIEPDVQIDQLRQAENHVRELPGEPVVTHVQLVQPLQILEFLRDRPAEPVRVEVENREIRQQAELLRQESGNVAVVEVNAGDRPDLAVFRRPIAKHVGVVTHVRPDPIRSKVARI
nr:hypothetical protein TorRG33x02_340930 [Ipomoea batatas]